MSLIDRAVLLHMRTKKPWIQPLAFHMHPDTAERADRECRDVMFIPLNRAPPGARLEQIVGYPLVRDPRVPPGVVAMTFKNLTGWRLVT